MGFDPPTGGPGLGDHEQPADVRSVPPALIGDLLREAGLPIESHQHRLNIRHDRFHLDDEHRGGVRVESEDVDRAPLAPDVERDLHRALPAGGGQKVHGGIDEACVRRVEEPIESFAVPGQPDLESAAEHRCDPIEVTQPQPVGLTSFGPTDLRPADPRSLRDVVLSQT